MAKKLNVWLNNKLNKSLHYTIVIKFYRIFVTELVLTFFVFKYQNHFEFPKGKKQSPRLKIPEIPGVSGGVIKDPLESKILGGRFKKSSVEGRYGYFLEPHIKCTCKLSGFMRVLASFNIVRTHCILNWDSLIRDWES